MFSFYSGLFHLALVFPIDNPAKALYTDLNVDISHSLAQFSLGNFFFFQSRAYFSLPILLLELILPEGKLMDLITLIDSIPHLKQTKFEL